MFITSQQMEIKRQEFPTVAFNQDTRYWTLRGYLSLLGILRNEHITLVHVEFPTQINVNDIGIFFFPLLVRYILRIPIVFTMHEFMDSGFAGKVRVIWLCWWSNYVICTNEIDRNKLAHFVFRFLRKSSVIEIGPTIKPIPATSSIKGSNTFMIAFLGMLDASKGIEDILYAMREMADASVHLSILTGVRSNNLYHESIIHLIKTLKLETQVYYQDTITDEAISQHLQQAQVVILPYVTGATTKRSTILDAFAHKVPVISTQTERTEQVLQESQAIVLIPPHRSDALIEAIHRIRTDPVLLEHLQVHMQAFMRTRNWEYIAQRTNEIYTSLLSK